MKAKLFRVIWCSIFLMFVALSCGREEQIQERELPKESLPAYTIVEIEGCEYFRFHSTHGYLHITHKGNCKNPIHNYNSSLTHRSDI